jgi:hypothetical protein
VTEPCAPAALTPWHAVWPATTSSYLPFEADAAHLFFQLVSRRYDRSSILAISNRSRDMESGET